MDSTRQQKVSRLIQKELGNFLIKSGRSLYGNVLVSVTDVRVSPDLSISRVQLSIFPNEQRVQVLEIMEDNKGKIRGEVAHGLRNQLRKMPELFFYIDDTFDRVAHIENLLKGPSK